MGEGLPDLISSTEYWTTDHLYVGYFARLRHSLRGQAHVEEYCRGTVERDQHVSWAHNSRNALKSHKVEDLSVPLFSLSCQTLLSFSVHSRQSTFHEMPSTFFFTYYYPRRYLASNQIQIKQLFVWQKKMCHARIAESMRMTWYILLGYGNGHIPVCRRENVAGWKLNR